jgi:hypothetical protein
MDSNPFADLIEQYKAKPQAPQENPFADLIAAQKAEREANATLTPEEQARVAQADEPEFGSGLRKRMQEYEGLSPEAASAKYIAGQKGTIRNVYNTVTDPSKLASVAGRAVKAGVNAVAHPVETAQNIGRHYYENPDSAVTDAAFAAFPARKAMGLLGGDGIKASKGMPRASVRDEGELLQTGGARIEEAKLNPAKVDADALHAPMRVFREATNTTVIENATVNNIAKRLENAYAPPKAKAMAPMTKLPPKERPPVTLTELHGHQQRLDDVINGPGKSEGRINEQGRAAIELKKAVTSMIDNHPESTNFKIGKHEYHRGKMSQSMADLQKRAEGRSMWRNGDEAGALQAEIQQFLRNKKNRYALTPEVRHKLGILSRDNKGKLIGAFGSKNIGGFTFARGVETMFGAPGIMAIPGHFARQDRNSRIVKEFAKLMEEIRAGGEVR